MPSKQIPASPDPRPQRTRKLLLQAFLDLSNEKSFLAITVGDIAQRAAVNRATFYAHFQDKDDLLESSMREKCRRLLADAIPQKRSPTPETWCDFLSAVLTFFAQLPQQCPQAARQWNNIVVNAMREELEAALQEWLITTRPVSSEQRLVIAAISGAIVTSGMRWLRGQACISPAKGAEELTRLILQGLG